MKLVAAILSLVFCVRLAQAQPAVVQPAQAPAMQEGDLSPNVAVGLSLISTAASWTLLLASAERNESAAGDTAIVVGALGTLVGPSLGHWYAHKAWTPGLTIRLVSAAVGVVGVSLVAENLFENKSKTNAGGGIVVAAGLVYLGGTVLDIATVGLSVEHYNARSHQLAMVPLVQPNTGSYGLALGGRF